MDGSVDGCIVADRLYVDGEGVKADGAGQSVRVEEDEAGM